MSTAESWGSPKTRSSLQASEVPDCLRLLSRRDREPLTERGGDWGAAETLDRSAWTSEVPGSACRLFLLLATEPVKDEDEILRACEGACR